MGLDLVEFAMSVEESFRLTFPDTDALSLETPRRLIDYLADRLPAAASGCCLFQRAFYRLRQSLCRRLGFSRAALCPDTDLLTAVPASQRVEVWQAVGQDMSAGRYWARLGKRGWFERSEAPRLSRLGEVAKFLVARNPCALIGEQEGWTRSQVAEVVHGLIREEFLLRPEQYTEDSRWSEDMGIA